MSPGNPFPRVDLRLAAACFIVAAYVVVGTVGHDPWKQDEAYTFGLVLHILQSGDWVVPTLAGDPFMEKPPLFYIAAAATARLASPWLELHDGARLASMLFMALGIACTALAARNVWGAGRARVAALLLVGTVGLAPHAHEMITDTALFAGFAVAALGLTLVLARPVLGGALTGTGIGIGFMSKGLVEPVMVGLAMVALPLAFRTWRSRSYLHSAGWALAFAAPWLLVWPTSLFERSDALFTTWFWTNNVGRYVGFAKLGADSEPWYYTRVLPWFSLPVLPLAAWGLWRARSRLAESHGLQLAAVLTVAIMAILGSAATARSLYLMPVLVPLTILASGALDHAPPTLLRWANVFTAIVAGVVVVLAWWIWTVGVSTGFAPHVPGLTARLPRVFAMGSSATALFAACLLTVLWVVALIKARHLSWAHVWSANVLVVWGVVMTLLLPWIDSAKSFREPFDQLARVVSRSDCVSSSGLGEPQRGMLDYYTGLKTLRMEEDGLVCPLHLLQSNHAGKFPPLPFGTWRLVWKGSRRGETVERFQLYAGEMLDPRYARR